ncbi:MAG: ATP-binding cassette domain-containing protein [Spirochaetales bacterium]|uniref:ATP-binding cassette domain-containing protein n=1 Tax=Candidatus Thalassospirochaeta sargassi TaxID=3119039 RepID=A0AAJ1MPL7_9SPIO|nr:ATP-binding cassette domain-containing protein [Spirochaetales bacterium]
MNKRKNLLRISDADLIIKRKEKLKGITLEIFRGDYIGIYGLNGSGKSLLSALIAGGLKISSGSRDEADGLQTEVVSSTERKKMLEEDRHNDDSEFMEGRVDPGRSVRDILGTDSSDGEIKRWSKSFGIEHILERGIRFLSTGEFRKMMIVRSILAKPDILVLDDPYTGLDIETRGLLEERLDEIRGEVGSLVLVSGRLDDLNSAHRLFLLQDGSISEHPDLGTIRKESMYDTPEMPVFENAEGADKNSSQSETELIRLTGVGMSYYDEKILNDINWTVKSGEHWQITGPNGSGKSSLLSLINGDSPKAYGQEIYLFGRKRGSGETVWEIKQNIGLVSGSLQRQHRISQNVLSVVISGFFDSIGLYDKPDPVQIDKARDWCAEFGIMQLLDKPFDSLSEGMKRSVLIIRAIVKKPRLLILDEPCQGLDDVNSGFVIKMTERVIERDHSTLLYVSHDPMYRMHAIDNVMSLVPHYEGGYTAEIS